MATHISEATVMPMTAVLLAAILGVQPAHAGTWQKNAAGTYSWVDASNWDTAFPNASSAVANLNIDLAGNETINLNQAITIGTLNAGDSGGNPTFNTTIASGTGGNPLTFQSTTAGAPTAININVSAAPASGAVLALSSGIKLGGTSPLTFTDSSTIPLAYFSNALNLNGNTFTLGGVARQYAGDGTTALAGAAWEFTSLTGSGAFVQNGASTYLSGASPSFTGTLTVNNGAFSTFSDLSGATQIAVGGAFEVTAPVTGGATPPGKYPIGGSIGIGNGGYPTVSTLPDRLNHNGTIVFNGGGYIIYTGQGLDASLSGSVVSEQVKQIRFNPGLSEIRLAKGANSSGTVLLANDATNAMVRQQGATFMIGGDDANAWAGLGSVEKFKFNSGMSSQLKGGGGSAGSQNVSIIPWMVCGTVYHPGQGLFTTYDSTNGVRALTSGEYYTGAVYGAPATANVNGSDLNLGANHTQTINAYTTGSWGNTDIGPGSTLTVSSGLVFFQANGSIGNGTPANAGTLNFASAEGILWSAFQAYNPNTVGSIITGTGGLTTSGTNVIILKGANTYTGKTTVGAGTLQVGDGILTTSKLGNGDVEVVPGATLRIKTGVANAIADTANVTLDNAAGAFFGKMELESGINETINSLVLNGTMLPAGTYGSSSSSATYPMDNYFTGPGTLTVAVPEPANLALLAFAGLLLRRLRA